MKACIKKYVYICILNIVRDYAQTQYYQQSHS